MVSDSRIFRDGGTTVADSVIESVLDDPSEERVWALLRDETRVFWVGWRQSDGTIIDACEAVLRTGNLVGEYVESEQDGGYRIFIRAGDRRSEIPLSYSLRDRHITMCALNSFLSPDYEIRLCLASTIGDTLAFIPLSSTQWRDLEKRFPETLSRLFYVLTETPNVFTDRFPPPITWQELANDPSSKLAAIKLYQTQHGVGMSAAKQAIDAYLAASLSRES